MHNTINDVTGLNPISVKGVLFPESIEEVQEAILCYDVLSVGGGHYSMGGQTSDENSIHVDLRNFNKILHLDEVKQEITVTAGTTWKEIQRYVDGYGLSVSIMQTYSNFTVGGSIGVNVHGRYIGAGPLILSLRSMKYVDAYGTVNVVSREENREAFEMLVGGYGSIGIIVEATLKLAENCNMMQVSHKMDIDTYLSRLDEITQDSTAIFHNADIYPPHYNRVNSVSWVETNEKHTHKKALQEARRFYPLEKYALWAISSTPLGAFRREYLYDKIIFSKKRVHTRNYEASYDVAELEPLTRKYSTYVLQEYFIPIRHAAQFIQKVKKVFQEYDANIINISIRHAIQNSESLLSWSRGEVLAFVVYYKQGTSFKDRESVSVWTRKAIDASIACEGAYYLPYQPHATKEQIEKAYPNFKQFAVNKKEMDPKYKFRNALFDKYIYASKADPVQHAYDITTSEIYKDKLYDFLRFVFRTDEKRVFASVLQAQQSCSREDEIYVKIQKECALSFKRILSPKILYHIYQQLKIQNDVIGSQSMEIIGAATIESLLMIEPTDINKPSKYYAAPSGIELKRLFTLWIPKAQEQYYIKDRPLLSTLKAMDAQSLDLVTVYGGLHHLPKEQREAMHSQIHRVLKPGGLFILREHDVKDENMFHFVSLIHAVFNAVTNETWLAEKNEIREFEPIEAIVKSIESKGFTDTGFRLKQYGDPSENILLGFRKEESV